MNSVVKDSMIGYVFKEKTRLRKTNDGVGWGVDVAPRLSGPPHPLIGVHKTSPNMTNKNHSKTHFFWPDTLVHKTIVSVNIAVYIRSSTTR